MGKRISPKGEFYGRDHVFSRNWFSYHRNICYGTGDVMSKKKVIKAICVEDKEDSTSYEIELPLVTRHMTKSVLEITVEVRVVKADAEDEKAPF